MTKSKSYDPVGSSTCRKLLAVVRTSAVPTLALGALVLSSQVAAEAAKTVAAPAAEGVTATKKTSRPGPRPRGEGQAVEAKPKQAAPEQAAPEQAAPEQAAPEQAVVSEPEGHSRRHTALVANMTLKVINPADTRKAVEKTVAGLGGFPVLVTERSIEVKLPPSRLSALLAAIAEQGLVVDKSLEREDVTLELAKLEGQLKSKRAILSELRDFFDSSDVAATLQIEKSMNDLVAELEAVKGGLRVLRERSRWAVVRLSFQFRERQRVNTVSSPFEWLNTVSLERFVREF